MMARVLAGLRSIRMKARSLLYRTTVERELDREIQFHLDMETEKLIGQGLPPAEAKRAALIAFGGVERFKEETRESRGTRGLETTIQDVRYALRGFFRAPGFTAVALLTLTVGIGGGTAMFSVVNGILLRPLPFPEPDRLVRVWAQDLQSGARYLSLTHQELDALRDQAGDFERLGGFSGATSTLTDDVTRPRQVQVARVTRDFFAALGARPVTGRTFTEEELQTGPAVVVLSHALWQSRYGADPGVVGSLVWLEGAPYTVVGVVREDPGFSANVDLWRVLSPAGREDDDREFLVVARLGSDATVESAQAAVSTLARRDAAATQPGDTEPRVALWVQPLHAMVTMGVRTPLLMLLAAVGLVLAIACVNVANLLLARGAARRRELAVRISMGASRARLIRQLLTESLVLALGGGALGVLLGTGLVRVFPRILPPGTPMMDAVTLDLRVLALATAVTVLSGIAFGLAPALRSSTDDVEATLRAAGAGGAGTRHRLQSGLVVAEVALSTVVVVSAGLLGTSFSRLTRVDRGFSTENLLAVPIRPLDEPESEQAVVYFQRVRQALVRVPGVESVGLGLRSPLSPRGINLRIFGMTGLPEPTEGSVPAGVQMVDPEYFATLGVDVVSGRGLTQDDRPESEAVVVINEAFARAYFDPAGLDAVGHELTRPSWVGGGQIPVRVVGVVADVAPTAGAPVQPQMFFPFGQLPTHDMTAAIRFQGDAGQVIAAVREALWAVDPTLALDHVGTVNQQLRSQLATERFNAGLLSVFAGVALLLAAVGVYGVLSYQVTERASEMGLRRAMGAQGYHVVSMVLVRGMTLAGVGILGGLLASLWTGRAMESLLFGVTGTDLGTLLGVAGLLALVAGLACVLPALRARRVDPMEALRSV